MTKHWRIHHQQLPTNLTKYMIETILHKPTDPELLDFDFFMEHILYNDEFVRKYLPRNRTFYMASIREPWSRLESHLQYFFKQSSLKEHLGLSTNSKLTFSSQIMAKLSTKNEQFLNRVAGANFSMFICRNQQLRQFGFPYNQQDNMTYIQEFINDLDFDLIHITELFDESLVLLKHQMCWTFNDILYIKLRSKSSYPFEPGSSRKKLEAQYEREYRFVPHVNFVHFTRITRKLTLKSLLLSNQKKDGCTWPCLSFFWYDNDKDLKVCFLMTCVI